MKFMFFIFLFVVGCTNTVVVKKQKHAPVFSSDRKGTIFFVNRDSMSGTDFKIIEGSVQFTVTKTDSRMDVPIDSVSRIEFFSRGTGALHGALFGVLAGCVTGAIAGSNLESKKWDDGEDSNREAIEIGQTLSLMVSIAGGAAVCSIFGYASGYKEIYVFK